MKTLKLLSLLLLMVISFSACDNPEEVTPKQKLVLGPGAMKITYYNANGGYIAHSIPVYAEEKIVFPEWIYCHFNNPYMFDSLYSGYKTYVNDVLIHEHNYTTNENHKLTQYKITDHNSDHITVFDFTFDSYPEVGLNTNGDAKYKFEYINNRLYKDYCYLNNSGTYTYYSIYTRNAEGLITSITSYSPDDIVLDNWFSAQYNAEGLVIESTNNEEKSTYTYDSQGRVVRIDTKDLADISTGYLIFEY